MRSPAIISVIALTVMPAAPLAAQGAGGFAAFLGLTGTPVGALPPLAPTGVPGRGVMLRYGQQPFAGDGATMHSVALSLDGGAGRRRVGWTIGTQVCSGCDARLMAGLDVLRPLGGSASGDEPRGGGLGAALAPSLGVAVTSGAFMASAALGVPLSFETRIGRTARLVPFVTPGIGVAVVVGGDAGEVGARPYVGGGVELTGIGRGFGVSAGAQKVFVDGADAQVGVALTWRRGSVAR